MLGQFNYLLSEEQDPKTVEKIVQKLSSLLMSGESINYVAVQKKPAVTIAPESVALTNKRIIIFRPKNLGLSMEFEDIIWKDVHDCHIKEGILGAEFKLTTITGTIHLVDYLPKAQARKLYALAQEEEENQRAYRRALDLEEKRASASNFNVHNTSQPASPNTTPAPDPTDPLIVLQKLKALLDNQLIEQSEYDAKKAEILGRM